MRFRDFLEYGIITAFNPGGKEHTPEENEEFNKHLRDDLKRYEIEEKEGEYKKMPETTFKVSGIGRKELVDLGKKYNQNSVIWNGEVISLKP